MSSRGRPTAVGICAVLLSMTWAVEGPGDLGAAGQTFTSRIEAVRVDVLVTADGHPVTGLSAADFEIRDNGVVQQIEFISFEKVALNVVLALDMSDSVSEQDLLHLREAGNAVTEALVTGDRVGLITFSHAVRIASPLALDVASVRAALAAARPGGDTSLVDAAHAAMAAAASPNARALVVMFGDGLDTSSWLSPELVLQSARRSEVVVYAVTPDGIGGGFLEDLTSASGGRLLTVGSTDRLRATFLQVLEEFRHRYLVSFTPRGPARPGWHRLQVRVKSRDATVRARAGYFAGS